MKGIGAVQHSLSMTGSVSWVLRERFHSETARSAPSLAAKQSVSGLRVAISQINDTNCKHGLPFITVVLNRRLLWLYSTSRGLPASHGRHT